MLNIIEALVWEHRAFCKLFDQVQRTLPSLRLPEIKRLTRHLENLLLTHAAAEDDLVLLASREASQQASRYQRLHHEHQEIAGQLTQIFAVNDPPEAQRLFRAVLAHSRRHFRYEEREVFPLLEQVMGAKTLQKLGYVWLLRRNTKATGGCRIELETAGLKLTPRPPSPAPA